MDTNTIATEMTEATETTETTEAVVLKELKISLNAIDKVKSFVNIVTKFDCDMDLIAENTRYVIDAKSIMGIFSLDLSKTLTLVIHSNDEDNAIETAVESFLV